MAKLLYPSACYFRYSLYDRRSLSVETVTSVVVLEGSYNSCNKIWKILQEHMLLLCLFFTEMNLYFCKI